MYVCNILASILAFINKSAGNKTVENVKFLFLKKVYIPLQYGINKYSDFTTYKMHNNLEGKSNWKCAYTYLMPGAKLKTLYAQTPLLLTGASRALSPCQPQISPVEKSLASVHHTASNTYV